MKDDQFIFETMPFAPLDSNPASGLTEQAKIRQIQNALNRALGLQLPLDGLMNFRTRRAIRMFQREKGIPADGIVNYATERALIAARSGQSSGASATKPAESDFPGYEFEAGKSPPARAAASPARKYPPFSLEPIIQRALGGAKPKQELEFFGDFSEVEGELIGERLTSAVTANRRLARQLGWACVVNDRLKLNEALPRPRLYDLLRLGASPSEEDFAKAVEQFQQTELRQRGGDGQLGPNTWNQLLRRNALDRGGVPPVTRFAPFSKPVFFGGRKLGVLEKTRAYERCFFDPVIDAPCRSARSGIAGEGGGSIIELGFRVTDMDAVRRAGFIDGYGEDYFRWIQVVNFITVPVLNAAGGLGFVRRSSGVIDPTGLVDDPATLDRFPYYWDEVTPSGADPGFNVDNFINRRAQNGLCYDLVFFDRPAFSLRTVSPPAPWTKPGSHAYFNFELALVGVRPGEKIKNFVLYTVRWGYDIFMKGGQPNVDLNGLHPGPTNGSPALKKILNREFNRDDVPFPGHCMAGSGYTGRANCKK
jgi:Putative peptidoglycan binding domain